MTDTYNDTTGSRKKFLIPLVVLLLCAVSLTGAGYAYNSTVTVNNNTTPAADYVLEVYDSTPELVTGPMEMTGMIVLQHETTIAATNQVIVSAEAKEKYVGKLVVNDEVGSDYTVNAAIPAAAEKTITDVTGGTGKIVYTLSVALFNDDGGAKGAAYDGSAVHGDKTFWYEVSVTISTADGCNAITFANEYDAQKVIDLVDAKVLAATFNLSFSADQVVP